MLYTARVAGYILVRECWFESLSDDSLYGFSGDLLDLRNTRLSIGVVFVDWTRIATLPGWATNLSSQLSVSMGVGFTLTCFTLDASIMSLSLQFLGEVFTILGMQ